MRKVFPEKFTELEAVAAPWALPTYTDRYRKRLNSSMEEIEEFYNTVFPRAREIVDYCNEFDINDPPHEVKTLLNAMYALIVVSFALEIWKQPKVPDTGDTAYQLESYQEPAV